MTGRLLLDVRQRSRVLLLLLRPALVVLLLGFAQLGLSLKGRGEDLSLTMPVYAAVLGFLLVAVAVNDLSDQAVDRINLPGKRSRPLATGTATSNDMVVTAVVGAVLCLAAASWLGLGVLAVACGGLVLALVYSIPPFSLSRRGAAASLVLPAGFVAVPFLSGALAAHAMTGSATWLMVGLYVGFIGRILLKDFRDVVGDTLLGKRTFLVRHGRRVTCAVSAVFWTVGSAMVLVVAHPSVATDVSYGVQVVGVLFLLRQLSRSENPRQDEAFVSAIAVLGRGCLLVLLGRYTLGDQPAALAAAVLSGLAVMSLSFAWAMARTGPVTKVYLPDWRGTVDRGPTARGVGRAADFPLECADGPAVVPLHEEHGLLRR